VDRRRRRPETVQEGFLALTVAAGGRVLTLV
jgi:hypothetical protein